MAYKKSNPNGQATMANSEPVVLASDQSAIPVTVSGVATAANQATIIGHVDGLETAVASTNTKLDTVNTNLTTIDGRVDGLETSNSAIQVATELLDDTVATLGTTTYTEAVNKGLVVGAVRRDANTTLVGTTNEVAPLQVNATGELKVAQIAALPAGTNNIGDVDVLTINGVAPAFNTGAAGATVQRVVLATDTTVPNVTGSVAHDVADSGNPVKVGGQARTTNPTAIADSDRSNFITDKLGKQVVVGSIRDLKSHQITTITSSTAETTVLTAVASTFLDVYGCIVVNSSATAANVSFKDATAGTTRFNVYVPAGETRGFMLPESGAFNQAAVNNNWTATSSASVASLVITMLAVRNI